MRKRAIETIWRDESGTGNKNKLEGVVQKLLVFFEENLTVSFRRPISCRNQSIDLRSKSMDWFLYDVDLRHERVKEDREFRSED